MEKVIADSCLQAFPALPRLAHSEKVLLGDGSKEAKARKARANAELSQSQVSENSHSL
jgi:hypothetical protein